MDIIADAPARRAKIIIGPAFPRLKRKATRKTTNRKAKNACPFAGLGGVALADNKV